MKNIDGGKAFAEGAYGCVFRPSLKCKNEKERKNGVSKLMLVDKAFSEYNEIKKFIKVLSKIPNFRSLFMFPYNVCKLSPLDKKIDLTGFDNKCDHFVSKGKINSKSVNKNLNKLRAITLPDGGKDVDMKAKELKKPEDFLKLNNSLLRLLKYGIVPMNYYKVYHFDIKDTNVLVDKDFTTRLTDWGLSGMIESKENIPSVIANRPLQSNLPFSNILFNPNTLTNIDEYYQEHKGKYTYKVVESFVKNEIMAISEDVGRGHYDYLKPIYNNIILKEQDFTLKEAIVKYITDVLYHWKHPKHGFDLKNYFFGVFLPNSDVWGFVTIYFAFLTQSKNMKEENGKFFEGIKKIIINHLLKDGHKPIDLRTLVSDLNNLNTSLVRVDDFTLNSNLPRTPETKFIEATQTISFEAVKTKKKKNIEKIIKRAEKNKTKKNKSKTKKNNSKQNKKKSSIVFSKFKKNIKKSRKNKK